MAKPSRPRPRLKPERIDDGVRRAERAEAVVALSADEVLEHWPSDEAMERARGVLEDGFSLTRKASLPNLEALKLLLAFLEWAGTADATRSGEGTPPRLAVSVAITAEPAASPPPPEDRFDPSEASSVAVADAHLDSLPSTPTAGPSRPLELSW